MPFPVEDAATPVVHVPLHYWKVVGGGMSAHDQLSIDAASADSQSAGAPVVRARRTPPSLRPRKARRHNSVVEGRTVHVCVCAAVQEWDEGMLLVAEAFLFAQCGGFIGTMDSNVARLVWELSSALVSHEQPNVYDMNGALWHPGWAASEAPYRNVFHHQRHCERAT